MIQNENWTKDVCKDIALKETVEESFLLGIKTSPGARQVMSKRKSYLDLSSIFRFPPFHSHPE